MSIHWNDKNDSLKNIENNFWEYNLVKNYLNDVLKI